MTSAKVFANRKSHAPEPKGRDNCQSPPYAVLPLLPYLPKDAVIWEPALGDGYLAQALIDHGYNVVTSSLDDGQNFFHYEPERWDILVTNPPWSLSAKWTRRCFEFGKPWALLLPTDRQQNVGLQKLYKKYGTPEYLHPDARIDYKMSRKGWDSAGAQINSNWYTYGLNIGQHHTYLCPIWAAKAAWKKHIERLAEIEAGQMELK